MTDLDLKELDRLERRVREVAPDSFNPFSGFCMIGPDVLRPLLDLVDNLAKALEDMEDKHLDYPSNFGEYDPLDDYRRARGEK